MNYEMFQILHPHNDFMLTNANSFDFIESFDVDETNISRETKSKG